MNYKAFTNQEQHLLELTKNNISFQTLSPANFSNSKHLKNFVVNYLFNTSPKYENENTSLNKYYFFQNGRMKEKFAMDKEEREQIALQWFSSLEKEPLEQLCNDIVYIQVADEKFENKVLQDNQSLELYSNVFCNLANLTIQHKNTSFLYSVLHYNQEYPHLHRILIKDKK